jgi:general stress protein 26
MEKKNQIIFNKLWVKSLLSETIIAKLGTANPKTNQPHVTPVWFEWDGENLWISAFISTRKAREVEKNPLISVLVDDHTTGSPARAVLLEGSAELFDDPDIVKTRALSLYTKYLGEEGVKEAGPASWVVDPENRIIKLTPKKVFVWGPEES